MHWLRRIVLATAVATGLTASGQALSQTGPTWTIAPAVVSQYVFRGVRLGGVSLQPTIEATVDNLVLGVWSNWPLQAKVPGQSSPEVDPYGSYRIKLSDALTVQPGFTWYTYPDAEPSRGFYRMTFEPSVALNYTVHGVVLSPKAYYDVVTDGATFELTGAYALPVRAIGSELDFVANVGTYERRSSVAHSAPEVKNWGDYWLAGVTLPYQIARNGRVSLGFAYTRGSGNFAKQGAAPKTINPAAAGRGVVTLGYSLNF
jgi:hypothetical protein